MRRRVGLFLAGGVVLPLVVAATASAQGSTIRISPSVARPGQVLTVTGSGYSPTAGAVSIRLSTRSGQILRGGVVPDPEQNISTSFPVPPLSPGEYLVLAIQTTDNGRQRAFTPGRAKLRVSGASAGAAAPPPGGRSGGPASPLMLAAPILALILLAAGSTLTVRRLLTHTRPQRGGWPTQAEGSRGAA
ncbi:MAG: hypothetical protein M3417_00025 [Actinomycetota bacterium]|nr:hypothetical protein [Actinomycetota bacterium]